MILGDYANPSNYEDFVPGTVVAHAQRRVVTETDNLLFSRLSGHEHPSLFPYATSAPEPVAVLPFLVLSICGGMAVRATSQGAIANLGWEYVRFPQRAHIGDELRAVTSIDSKRLSKSNPARGVVTIITYGLNQNDAVVLEAKRSFLVRTRVPVTDGDKKQ
jgi:itaconyl-CoA hydratase